MGLTVMDNHFWTDCVGGMLKLIAFYIFSIVLVLIAASCDIPPSPMEVRAKSLESTYHSVKGRSEKAMICKTECVDWSGRLCLSEVSKCFYTDIEKEEK